MHHIERDVLIRLIQEPELRYSDLKPKGMEGSLFSYHLKQVMKSGLIKKTDRGVYSLTSTGMLMADKMQLETFRERLAPRIVVLVAIRDKEKGWLLFRRKMQPVINMLGFPHVNIDLGSELVKTAQSKFKQDSNLDVEFDYRGHGYLTMYRDDKPESYIMFHLLYGEDPLGVVQAETDTGTHFWAKDIDYKDPDVMPSMKDLVTLLESDQNFFFIEKEYHL